VEIFLQYNSGEMIELSTEQVLEKEYYAAIPNNLVTGFVDVVARVKDAAGNKFEFTASPAFFFGNSLDEIQYDSRIRMSTYKLDNVKAQPYEVGDTLNYTFTYTNYGNITAKDITVYFPTTEYLQPVEISELQLDSLEVDDECKVSVSLVLRDKPLNEHYMNYTPEVHWTSDQRSCFRKHRVLLDLDNVVTNLSQSNSTLKYGYTLHGNYPNPFNSSTKIKYTLNEATPVKISIYDVLGRHVKTLVNNQQAAGDYHIDWDGRNIAGQLVTSGMYFYRFQTKRGVKIRKLLLLK
jgi:hypothetical protein